MLEQLEFKFGQTVVEQALCLPGSNMASDALALQLQNYAVEGGTRIALAPFAIVGRPLRLPSSKSASDALALQLQAHGLLCALRAQKLACKVRVEWNPRLKTCAGRVDYRAKLISLNPRLRDHPGEVDRTLRHELAHLLAQFRVKRRCRIQPHGKEWRQACCDLGIADEARCHNLQFATKAYVARFVYRCPNCRRDFPRVRRIRRALACLACCRAFNRGKFDSRFRLKFTKKL